MNTLLVGGAIFLVFPFSFAYDDETTHPALTQEIITFYNKHYPPAQIVGEETEHVIRGSKEEDAFGRWMRHYYDPVHQRGLSYLGSQWQAAKEWSADTIAQATYKPQRMAQRSLYGSVYAFFSGDDDYSWERGVYEYAWGDKKRALEALGHVLHLIEDMSVPDHTRNDPHPAFGSRLQELAGRFASDFFVSLLESHDDTNASPYETFAKFQRGTINTAEELKDKQPVLLGSLTEYFDAVANYSNNNFFSKDTIFSPTFGRPILSFEKKEKLNNGRIIVFGYNNDGQNDFHLVGRRSGGGWVDSLSDKNRETPFLVDDDHKILTDYWRLLSKQAVLHGAGVVKLFFDEVGKEKKSRALYAKNRSWLGKKIDNIYDRGYQVASVLYGSSVRRRDLEAEWPGEEGDRIAAPTPAPGSRPTAATENKIIRPPIKPVGFERNKGAAKSETVTSAPLASPRNDNETIAGGSTSSNLLASGPTPTPTPIPIPAPPPHRATTPQPVAEGDPGGKSLPFPILAPRQYSTDTTPPAAPTVSSPASNQAFTAASDVDSAASGVQINVSGTTEANATITVSINPSWTGTADGSGNYSVKITLNEGANTITFKAKDAAGNESSATTITATLDSTAPEPTISVSNYAIAKLNYTVSWALATTTPDFASYDVEQRVGTSSSWTTLYTQTTTTATTSTSTKEIIAYFRARARDTKGNISSWVETSAETNQRPVVINEIMYNPDPGDDAFYEYLELYNRSSTAIDLTNWTLTVDGDVHSLLLDNTASSSPQFSTSSNNMIIAPGGFAVVGDKPVNQSDPHIYDGVHYTIPQHASSTLRLTIDDAALLLINASPYSTLTLKDPDARITDELVYSYQVTPPIGANGNGKSLERVNPAQGGYTTANWAESPVGGTPNAQNASYNASAAPGTTVIDTTSITTDTLWSKAASPYLLNVSSGKIPKVSSGATLYIEPGVTVKPQGFVTGSVTTSASFEIEGALRAEGTALEPILFTSKNTGSTTTPAAAGDWGSLVFKSTSQNSLLKYATLEYGGGGTSAPPIVWVVGSSPTFENVTIKRSANAGIYSDGDTAAPIIRNSTFENNATYGIDIERGGPTIQGNAFTQNLGAIRFHPRARPLFSGNTASSQTSYNAIYVRAGDTTATTTWKKDLPYILEANAGVSVVTVASSTKLTLEAGVVLKPLHTTSLSDDALVVKGELEAIGTASSPIIITSLKDDSRGGDSNADGSGSTPASADWKRILFKTGSTSRLEHWIVAYGSSAFGGPLAEESGSTLATSSVTLLP